MADTTRSAFPLLTQAQEVISVQQQIVEVLICPADPKYRTYLSTAIPVAYEYKYCYGNQHNTNGR